MDYLGIDIRIEKRRYIERIPTDGPYSKMKDVVASENTVLIHLCGFKVPDPTFAFELQAILEEFINKKLGSYKETTSLNSIFHTDDNDTLFYITRKESLLLITLQDYEGVIQAVMELDAIKARALAALVSKAIHVMDLY